MKDGSGLRAGSRSSPLGNAPSGEDREDREREEEHGASAIEPERKCGALQLLRRDARCPGDGRKDDEGGDDEGEALHDHLKDQGPALRTRRDELRKARKKICTFGFVIFMMRPRRQSCTGESSTARPVPTGSAAWVQTPQAR